MAQGWGGGARKQNRQSGKGQAGGRADGTITATGQLPPARRTASSASRSGLPPQVCHQDGPRLAGAACQQGRVPAEPQVIDGGGCLHGPHHPAGAQRPHQEPPRGVAACQVSGIGAPGNDADGLQLVINRKERVASQ